jgi:hypothetical protein
MFGVCHFLGIIYGKIDRYCDKNAELVFWLPTKGHMKDNFLGSSKANYTLQWHLPKIFIRK